MTWPFTGFQRNRIPTERVSLVILLAVLLLIGLLFGLSALFTAAKWLLIFAVVFWLIGWASYRRWP